jgi:vacuolar-type H+-ATPase subunit H
MEARARAAVAKLQELTQQGLSQRSDDEQPSTSPSPPAPATGAPAGAAASSGDVPDMIARTLLLAQRTADAAIADARRDADTLVSEGREEASRLLESARAMAARTVDDARHEARRSAEDERVRIENEVQALLARRDFLVSDIDHLELYVQTERERLREAANQLFDLIDRVPGGLGETRRPLLSAAAETDSFWVEPTPGPRADSADATAAIGNVPVPGGALPLFPAVPVAVDGGALVGDERELVDATVEVLHRLLPDVDAAAPTGVPAYDDWDDSGPTAVSRSDAAADDPWNDGGLPESSEVRSVGGFDDDSFWAMPRPEGDRSFADLSDEIPRPVLDDDATVPMTEPTPVNGDLRIGGDELD